MEDYCSNQQTVGESPNEQSVDKSPPEQLVGDFQSVGVASEYENRHQRLIATNRYDGYVKATTECSRKSRSEKEQMLLEKSSDHPAVSRNRLATEKYEGMYCSRDRLV